MRRTSISSIPAGIQRPCSISKVTPEAELLIPSLPVRGIAVSSISIPKRSTRFAVFVAISVVLSSLFSPATASDQNSPAVLTSQLPWLAPTGHRQPRRADVPQEESLGLGAATTVSRQRAGSQPDHLPRLLTRQLPSRSCCGVRQRWFDCQQP
jgi:hypothetical protein